MPPELGCLTIGSFMLWLGPTSSVFDWITYLVLYFVICPQVVSGGVTYNQIPTTAMAARRPFAGMDVRDAYEALFQAGWFVESMWTQTWLSAAPHPQDPLPPESCVGYADHADLGPRRADGSALYGIARALGFLPLPGMYFGFLALVVIAYMLLATSIKKACSAIMGVCCDGCCLQQPCQRSAVNGQRPIEGICGNEFSLSTDDIERLTMNDQRRGTSHAVMDIEPLFWIGMGAVAAVICLMQIVCWSQAPTQRHG